MIKLFRFAIIGIISNATGYLLYLYITYLGVSPKIAMTVLYGIGATIGFFGNRNYTFSDKGSFLKSGRRYVLTHCFGYLINFAIQIILVDKLGYVHQLAQAIGVFTVALFLFVMFKYYVFTESRTVPA